MTITENNSFIRRNVFWSIKIKDNNQITTYKNIPYGKDSTFINDIVHALKKDQSFQYTVRGYVVSNTDNGNTTKHSNVLYKSYTISALDKNDNVKEGLYNLNKQFLSKQEYKHIHYFIVSINIDASQVTKGIKDLLSTIDQSNIIVTQALTEEVV